MKKIFVTIPLLAALAFTGAGAASATEPPTFEPGTVTESGVVVGDNADLYGSEPVQINMETPVPSYDQMPPLTKADVEPDAVPVQPLADDVYGSYPAPAPIIEEDEPGWDCETMGNGVCGPAADTGDVADQPTELAYTGMTDALGFIGAIILLVGIILVITSTHRARSKR